MPSSEHPRHQSQVLASDHQQGSSRTSRVNARERIVAGAITRGVARTTMKPVLLMLAVAAALVLTLHGVLSEQRPGVCDTHRNAAALVTRQVLVYGSRGTSLPTTSYYACLRPSGRRVELGTDELGALYGSDVTTGEFSAAGSYVAAQSSAGVASLEMCARYNNPRRCSRARYWVTVVDTKTRRLVHVPVYASAPVSALVRFPVTVALSAKGALAWLQKRTVGAKVGRLELRATGLAPCARSRLAVAPVMVDAGPIEPSSVRFHGGTLYWARDGGSASARAIDSFESRLTRWSLSPARRARSSGLPTPRNGESTDVSPMVVSAKTLGDFVAAGGAARSRRARPGDGCAWRC